MRQDAFRLRLVRPPAGDSRRQRLQLLRGIAKIRHFDADERHESRCAQSDEWNCDVRSLEQKKSTGGDQRDENGRRNAASAKKKDCTHADPGEETGENRGQFRENLAAHQRLGSRSMNHHAGFFIV